MGRTRRRDVPAVRDSPHEHFIESTFADYVKPVELPRKIKSKKEETRKLSKVYTRLHRQRYQGEKLE